VKYITDISDVKLNDTCITIGKFDGIHIGHQLLLQELSSYAKARHTSVVLSFVFQPGSLEGVDQAPLIYTEAEKRSLLSRYGIDVLISCPFAKEMARMEPEDFIRHVMKDKLDARVVVVGERFCFGRGRRGNTDMLMEYSKVLGYELRVCKRLGLNDRMISSTLIKEELSKGNMDYVNAALGSPYAIMGNIRQGDRLGRRLGHPTINIVAGKDKLLPPNGVYFSRARIQDRPYDGITNIGYKPTVRDRYAVGHANGVMEKGIETFLFDFDEDVYGYDVAIELYKFHRDEFKFDTLDELQSQIMEDAKSAKAFFLTYEI